MQHRQDVKQLSMVALLPGYYWYGNGHTTVLMLACVYLAFALIFLNWMCDSDNVVRTRTVTSVVCLRDRLFPEPSWLALLFSHSFVPKPTGRRGSYSSRLLHDLVKLVVFLFKGYKTDEENKGILWSSCPFLKRRCLAEE